MSAWQQFALAYQQAETTCGSALYVISGSNFAMADCVKHLRQYFRHVRPGAVRLGASSSDGSIDPVAFRNPDGKIVVVANTDGAATLRVAGLPAGTYRITHVTGWTGSVGSGGSVTIPAGGLLAATIPGQGVITIAP